MTKWRNPATYREVQTAGRECLSALLEIERHGGCVGVPSFVQKAIERNRPLLLEPKESPK